MNFMGVPWKHTLAIRYFGFTKIPLIYFVKPSVLDLGPERCSVKIRLRRRTKNHVSSMYFGVLAVGADLAGGILAMQSIAASKRKINLIFKDIQADFLKRVDGDAIFTCVDGHKIESLIQKVVRTGERHHQRILVEVTSPEKYGDEILANFTMNLSLKVKD